MKSSSRSVIATVFAMVFVLLSPTSVAAQPSCTLYAQNDPFITEADVRSELKRGVIISVTGDTVVASGSSTDQTARATAMNGHASTGSDSGKLTAERIATIPSESLIQVILTRVLDYDIYQNDTLTMWLPDTIFTGGVSCGTVEINATATFGTLTDDIPEAGLPETTVNSDGATYTFTLEFDQFLPGAEMNVSTTSGSFPPGLAITPEVLTAPSKSIKVFVVKDETFNIPKNTEIEVTFNINATHVESGILPKKDPREDKLVLVLKITGVTPSIAAINLNGAGQPSLRAEDVWDGKAQILLRVSGDVFNQDPSLWSNENTGPTFGFDGPPQTFGFDFCTDKDKNPYFVMNATLTTKTATITFPPCYGYSLSIAGITSEQVSLNRFNLLISENVNVESTSFIVLRADQANMRVDWFGDVFNGLTSESSIRKEGINFGVTLKYNVFVGLATIESNFKSIISNADQIILDTENLPDNVKFTFDLPNVTHPTTLNFTFFPQSGYDIAADENVKLVIPTNLLVDKTKTPETDPGPSISGSLYNFTIRAITTESICEIFGSLDEEKIRNNETSFSVKIISGDDSFCYRTTPGARQELMDSVTEDEKKLMSSSVQRIREDTSFVSPTEIRFIIEQTPDFDIDSTTFINVGLPRSLMCQQEVCQAKGAGLGGNFLDLNVEVRAGTLIVNFPAVTEDTIRTEGIRAEVFVIGDGFRKNFLKANFLINSSDPLTGFATTLLPIAEVRRDDANGNLSRGFLEIPANKDYDITEDETVTINFDINAGELMNSGKSPKWEGTSNPLVIRALRGNIVSNIAYNPETNTFNQTVDEKDVVEGKVPGLKFVLQNERWNATQTPAAVRQFTLGETTSNGFSAQKSTILADSSFDFTKKDASLADGTELTITFGAAPNYDIQEPDQFTLRFTSLCTSSGNIPHNATYLIYVIPAPSELLIGGSGIATTSLDIVRGGNRVVLSLTVVNDLWDLNGLTNNEPTFRTDGCGKVASDAECAVSLSTDNRVLTVVFLAVKDYYITRDQIYELPVREKYFASGKLPVPSIIVMNVKVESGFVEWVGGPIPRTVTEEDVRLGNIPVITANVLGDRFADLPSFRSSLVQAVSCVGTNDAAGFCARAAVLFGGSEFKKTQPDKPDRQIEFKLQPDPGYDIYEQEVVTIALDRQGLQSRLDPAKSEEDVLRFTVVPTTGNFFLTGSYGSMTQKDLLTEEDAKKIKLVLTLYGERWLPNTTLIHDAIFSAPPAVEGSTNDSPYWISSTLGHSQEPDGFLNTAQEVITAEGSSISDGGRVLTIQFRAAPRYNVVNRAFSKEVVNVAIPPAAVLSPFQPRLTASGNAQFSILFIGGQVDFFPKSFTAQQLQEEGMVVEFALAGGDWGPVVQQKARIDQAILTTSSPQTEPSGFAVYRDRFMAHLQSEGVGFANGTGNLVFNFSRVPEYQLIRPEKVTVQMASDWSGNNRPLVPDRFDITINPDFFPVQATVVCSDGIFHIENWIKAVAKTLQVLASSIEVNFKEDPFFPYSEPFIPGSTTHKRISFRVQAPDDPEIPYDNQAANKFIALDQQFTLRTFNVVTAFYNQSAPPDSFWANLQVQGGPEDETADPLNFNLMFIFVGALIVIFFVVFAFVKYNSGKLKTGNARKRDVEQERGKIVNDEMTEKRNDENAVYAGQAKIEARLDGTQSSKRGLLNLPQRDVLTAGGVTGIVASKPQPTYMNDDFDDDLPDDLYVGQKSTYATKSKLEKSNPWATIEAPDVVVKDTEYSGPPVIPAQEIRAQAAKNKATAETAPTLYPSLGKGQSMLKTPSSKFRKDYLK